MKIVVNDIEYKLIKNEKEGFDLEVFKEKCTDYFNIYDYILGDWAYGKLRLKGFNKKTNKNFKDLNDYSKVDDYLKNNCAAHCRYFIVEKIIVEK